MNRVPKTHEELLLLFAESVQVVLDEIDKKQKVLKKTKDDEEITKLHHTKKIIQAWFRMKGNLPIPD